jgi:DnaA-homolog protein
VISVTPQIPFELFEPEPPTLGNFLIGENAEAVTLLCAIAENRRHERAVTLWGAPASGKTHLLRGLIDHAARFGKVALFFDATNTESSDPFADCDVLAVDDADRLSETQQAWLFTAFNHVTSTGGTVVTSGATPPQLWSVRDDLRTRMGSGIVLEVKVVPQDSLVPLLFDYALQRGVKISEEVLTYVLSHTKRDISHLCQTIGGIDRMSLALKRPITLPLVRAYLAQQMSANSAK